MTTIDQCYAMLDAGRDTEAVAALEHAGEAGDAGALRELALWRLQGLAGPRDLVQSRAFFAAAAGLGDRQARMIHLSFVAQGIGGPSDWLEAMRLLRLASRDDPDATREIGLIAKMRIDDKGRPLDPPTPRLLSDRPEVRLFRALLSAIEAEAMIAAALPVLNPSVVVDPRTGRAVPHPVRSSDSCSFPYVAETPFIHALNLRFAAASGTPIEAGEPLQVLRYRPAQEYKPHFDALPGTENQRILTMLIYLNRDYDGGETQFMATGMKVAGEVGDALLFRNADDAGRSDPLSRHAGLPVARGEKFLATRWIRQSQFGPR